MDDRYYGILAHDSARQRAAQACATYPDGYIVRIEPPTRNKAQNARLHAIFRDMSEQWQFMGRSWDRESLKRLMVDAFTQEMSMQGTPLQHAGGVIPSVDGRRFVQLGAQTAQFTVQEMSLFIDYLQAFCAENGVELHG